MEKYLTAEWFKKKSFPTKMDGISFIKKHKKLSQFLHQKDVDIQKFKDKMIQNFDNYFESFEDDIKIFLSNVKEKQRERISNKKEIKKQALKEELKEEIRKEMMMEKYEEFIPKYDKTIDYNNIDDVFFEIVVKKLTKRESIEIKKLKQETEKAFLILTNVSKKIEEINDKF